MVLTTTAGDLAMQSGFQLGAPGSFDHFLARFDPAGSGAGVFLSEILASNTSLIHPDGTYPDFVELGNRSGDSIDLSRHLLSDNPDWPDKCVIPEGARIDPGARVEQHRRNVDTIRLGGVVRVSRRPHQRCEVRAPPAVRLRTRLQQRPNHLHMAEMAMAQGQRRVALRRTWASTCHGAPTMSPPRITEKPISLSPRPPVWPCRLKTAS